MKCQLDARSIPGIFVFRSQREQERNEADESDLVPWAGVGLAQSVRWNSELGGHTATGPSHLLPQTRGLSSHPQVLRCSETNIAARSPTFSHRVLKPLPPARHRMTS